MTEPEPGPRCHYCPEPATTRDHIVPRSRYGLTRDWNLVPACQPCNGRKGSAMPKCPCDVCQAAVSRWRQGERAKYTPAERRALQGGSQARPAPVPAKAKTPAPVEIIPPELACLSSGMRAYLIQRARKES